MSIVGCGNADLHVFLVLEQRVDFTDLFVGPTKSFTNLFPSSETPSKLLL